MTTHIRPETPQPHDDQTPTSIAGAGYVVGSPYVNRSRSYAFVLDEANRPIELGAGRSGKAYLGEERWTESKTGFRRPVAIKMLQRGVSADDRARFHLEKQILERVQGHPNIIELVASGEADNPSFVPLPLRDKVENDFMILELMEMSLEERLKGTRDRRDREDLLVLSTRDRLFRVLDYLMPVASAVEYAHRVRDTSHRDIKPGNILIQRPDHTLAGAQLKVKLADFNVGRVAADEEIGLAQGQGVPGTLYFQSPEQEVGCVELLVSVTRGSAEVVYFEDFYTDVTENDSFTVFNRDELYPIVSVDRARKRIQLARPFAEATEQSVRGKVVKRVGRPADIYSLGALLYYLVSGAHANPKGLHDSFRRFIEYERRDENNTVTAFIQHEYSRIQSLRTPRLDEASGQVELAPSDRFFSYKHFLDGNGELIDPSVMLIIARAMIRNKPDSYCLSWDVRTEGITELVRDLIGLYATNGVDPAVRAGWSPAAPPPRRRARGTSRIARLFRS
ncbi:MAG TPA: protein kinase [Kofleriaceae bacterium]|nr:protein kinase [Kofleriaceae bacterium]